MWARDFRLKPAKEINMNMSSWIRQFHRWMSVIFTTAVVAIFILLGSGNEPAQWVYYLPLFPLTLLMVTGIYMFVLPYAVKWRSERRAGAIN
jgi:ABC-type polysaccharide/polyol phosphate export permease